MQEFTPGALIVADHERAMARQEPISDCVDPIASFVRLEIVQRPDDWNPQPPRGPQETPEARNSTETFPLRKAARAPQVFRPVQVQQLKLVSVLLEKRVVE
jgi:hypothetical protein